MPPPAELSLDRVAARQRRPERLGGGAHVRLGMMPLGLTREPRMQGQAERGTLLEANLQ